MNTAISRVLTTIVAGPFVKRATTICSVISSLVM
jgi:hypothetical protein